MGTKEGEEFVLIDSLLIWANFLQKFFRESGSSNFVVLRKQAKRKLFWNGKTSFKTLYENAKLDDLSINQWCNFYANLPGKTFLGGSSPLGSNGKIFCLVT